MSDSAVLERAPIDDVLRNQFHLDHFLPGQREVIEHLLEGRSAAAVFPTGGGKSLCYQLPALLLPGRTIVVSPLIALMKDQIDALTARGVAAARLDSTLDAQQYSEVMRGIRSGAVKILYVAPERFMNERFREAIQQIPVSLFAVDEAHCISEWGHNFRPDYLKLAHFAGVCGAESILGLTATATPAVLEDICRLFRIDPQCAVRTVFYRQNLTLLTTPTAARPRDELLRSRLHDRPAGPTIVYVTLQRTAEEVAQRLARDGFPARPYHAGLPVEVREQVQDWFMAADEAIVVATIAFGMGIDKSNIRYVYHYNLPKSIENYTQEIGRAGRDGMPSTCELFACTDDLNTLENFVYGNLPSQSSVEGLVNELFSSVDLFDVSHYALSFKHDIPILVLRTLLTYLELDGYLEAGTPFYSSYQLKPLVSSAQILGQFEGERRAFLEQVLRQARQAKAWLHLDVDRAAAVTKSPRDRVIRALEYLGEREMLEVRAAGVRNTYRLLKKPDRLEAVTESLVARTREREAREIARLHAVLQWAANDGCQVSALGEHFGEPLDKPCGHCSWCLGQGKPVKIAARNRPDVDAKTWNSARRVRQKRPELLGDPRSLTRFLCGVSSPKLSRAKVMKDPLFGALAHVPFQQVLEQAEAD